MDRHETSIPEGPINNPEWTDEQNRRFDTLDANGFQMVDARREALGSRSLEDIIMSPKPTLPDPKKTKLTSRGEVPPKHVADELRTPRDFTPIKETPEARAAREQAMRDFPPRAA